MLYGTIVSVDSQEQKAQVEQDLNRRIFDFSFDVWEDELSELKQEAKVEFVVEMRQVAKIRLKPKPVDPNQIPIDKSPSLCIEEYFSRENKILEDYKDYVAGNLRLDFIRMRRFLFTAYNDLCAMDSNIENDVLKKLKIEMINLFKEYENYDKKTQYALNYAFEVIFLSRQLEYNKTVKQVGEIQSLLANSQARIGVLNATLEDNEKNLGKRNDRGSKEYQEVEKEVKIMRKQYVDLLDFIGKQKELLVKRNACMKAFREEHFLTFKLVYTPMINDLKTRFITLLDTKAYEFDEALWGRAKRSQNIKNFFRNSRIEGSFSSKTFLRYFLRGLDKTKLTSQSKELFELLRYLESINRKSLLIVRETMVNILKYQQVIEQIDSSLLISVDSDPITALKNAIENPQDIIVIDEKIKNVTALGFIKTYRESKNTNTKTTFCVVVQKLPPSEITSKAKLMGVEFIPEQNMDMLYDCIRMAL